MIKRSPSRNQRSRGIKLKHVLQICLLIGVCFWLIYQVKHSHDKKKEFDEKDSGLVNLQSDGGAVKLGRKAILPEVEKTATNEKHEKDEEDEENGTEEEDNKHVEEEIGGNNHEEEEREEDNKNEEEEREEDNKRDEDEQEDEETKNGDDEVNEQEQEHEHEHEHEQAEGEVDREDEFIDEEKEREGDGNGNGNGEKRENEGNESKEKDGQAETENSLNDQESNGGEKSAHEAREEHYKNDDASSAVTHDTDTINSVEFSSENSNENPESSVLEHENKSNDTEVINSNVDQNNSTVKLGGSSNATVIKEKEDSEYRSDQNSTMIDEKGKNLDSDSLKNGIETQLVSDQHQNVTEGDSTNGEGSDLQTVRLKLENDTTFEGRSSHDLNLTLSLKTGNESVSLENTAKSNVTSEGEKKSSGFEAGEEDSNKTQSEKSDEKGERSDLKDEAEDGIQHDHVDSSDSSIGQEEKEVRLDLDTLPDLRTDVNANEEAAAE